MAVVTEPSPRTCDVLVIGGGISGLAAAHEARRRLGSQASITVVEATDVLGGKLKTANVDDVAIDVGAESLITRRPEAVGLIDEVGITRQLVTPAAQGAGVLIGGRVRPLPRHTVLGIPQDLRALAVSDVMSTRGLLRVPLDRVLPRTPFESGETVEDIAIGKLVAARLGREVVDRLVEPLLGGIYAGHADQLSLAAAVPELARETLIHGSLLAAATAMRNRGAGTASSSVFTSLRDGLGTLPSQIAQVSDLTVLLSARAELLEKTPTGWRVTVTTTGGARVISSRAVIVATPAFAAAPLLAEVVPAAATILGGIDYASVAIVSFLIRAADVVSPLSGAGLLVPPAPDRLVKAVTFASQKWAWLGESAGGRYLIRCSIGRFGDTAWESRDDADLAGNVWDELTAMVPVSGQPQAWQITRWAKSLPQYWVGHVDRVVRVRREIEARPGLGVCGAALEGVGIAACVASGQGAAQQALRALAAQQAQ